MKRLLRSAAVAAAWLTLWQILYMCVGSELILPAPLSVAGRILSLASGLPFWQDIAASLLRIISGYLSALAIGTALGALTARFGMLDAFLSPVVRIVRATPVASFIILMFLFISKERIPSVISFLMVLPVVWSNVYEGIKKTDVRLLEMACVFRIGRAATLRHVYFPGIMPFFMAAARTGMGLAWKAGIAAEVLASPALGIGVKLYDAKIYLETADLFAWTAVIVLISVVLERLFLRLMRRVYDTP